MRKLLIASVIVSVLFSVTGCSSDTASEPAAKGEKPASTDLTKTDNLTPEQQELAKSRGVSGESSAGDNKETEGGR
ncbi:MAG: hypothetical protein KF784_11310 [Fimbriimonadaceae bacterium]|nr:hypothetical protein [Fimbriimonadaceae bacterium]